MYLKQLNILNFKNRPDADLQLSDNINLFVGNNGVGKTTVLDAIYHLAFTKSYFHTSDSQNILNNEPFFVIEGLFEFNENEQHTINCGVKKGRKKIFKWNKKAYDKFTDHIGRIPLVMVTPSDIELIYDGSEVRRKLLDSIISQYNKAYLIHLQAYNKVVQQRNALLKQFAEQQYVDEDMLALYNDQMVEHGVPIFEERIKFSEEFLELFNQHFVDISGGEDKVSWQYESQLKSEKFIDVIRNGIAKDLRMRYSTVGIHKDDLRFEIDGKPLKKFGSQGQQKSFLLALRLAQYQFIERKTGLKPLILLDDIFDKLDADRTKALLNKVGNGVFGQVFVTDTHPERASSLLNQTQVDLKEFMVTKEKIEEIH